MLKANGGFTGRVQHATFLLAAWGCGGSGVGPAGTANANAGGASAGTACAGLQLDRNLQVAGSSTDRVTWNDSRCRPRSAALARVGGGYVRQYTYEVNGKPRVATGTGAAGHHGWGYTVNHGGNGLLGQDMPGDYHPLFVGAHHLVYEYAFELAPGLPVKLHWLFATGRDHPLLAIHYDMTGLSPASVRTRARRTGTSRGTATRTPPLGRRSPASAGAIAIALSQPARR